MPPNSSLAQALADVRAKITKAGSKGLGEQNTKATLINPVLRALGWDTDNVEEVYLEYPTSGNDKPVDYALLDFREPRLFIEAKALGTNLDDAKCQGQIMMYSGLAGMHWIILTDGNEYRLYNGHAPVPVQEKLLRSVRISEGKPEAVEILSMLSKDQLKIATIDQFWRADFVDRQVKKALDGLLEDRNDMVLVTYVRQRTKDISDEEIRSSIRRCSLSVEVLTPERLPRGKGQSTQPKSTLAELIEVGILHPPVKLFCTYKDNDLSAQVERDGAVVWNGQRFQSLSLAASAARASIRGRREDGKLPATNGWIFWKYKSADGQTREMDHARQEYLKAHGRTQSSSGGKAASAG